MTDTTTLAVLVALGLAVLTRRAWRALGAADQLVRDALADLEHKD